MCDLDGLPVNPSNGHTTAGKTGLMRCRDGDNGAGWPANRNFAMVCSWEWCAITAWLVKGRYEALASGVHQQFEDAGRLRRERHHDARGRVNSERDMDESGAVTSDDEAFGDGSRKSLSR